MHASYLLDVCSMSARPCKHLISHSVWCCTHYARLASNQSIQTGWVLWRSLHSAAGAAAVRVRGRCSVPVSVSCSAPTQLKTSATLLAAPATRKAEKLRPYRCVRLHSAFRPTLTLSSVARHLSTRHARSYEFCFSFDVRTLRLWLLWPLPSCNRDTKFGGKIAMLVVRCVRHFAHR